HRRNTVFPGTHDSPPSRQTRYRSPTRSTSPSTVRPLLSTRTLPLTGRVSAGDTGTGEVGGAAGSSTAAPNAVRRIVFMAAPPYPNGPTESRRGSGTAKLPRRRSFRRRDGYFRN